MAFRNRSRIDRTTPFISSYNPDGNGRDTYINFDNGGFSCLYNPRNSFDAGTTYIHSKKRSLTTAFH